MSNDYFNYGILLPAGIARAGDVDARFQAIETAFGYLPSRATFGLEIKPVVTAGGTANALTVTNAIPLSSYTEGQRVSFKASASNTGAATINVDGLGAKAIKRADATTVSAGDIVSGIIYDVVYNSSSPGYFQFVAATVGELSTYAAAASASATSASGSAATAAAQASAASTSAAAALASQTAAATSATTASGAATTATTKAGEAASSASTASGAATTATTKAGEAATSATNAATSETNAATSASTATTKASQAATSATNAATSATNAAGSASTAATLVAKIPDATGQPAGVYLSWDGSTWTYTTPSGILPAISAGTSGKWLTNNGTAASWATLGSLAAKSAVNNADWSGTALAVANGGTGATTASAARTALGVVPGTDVQAQNANLSAIAGVTSAADKLFYFTGSGTGAVATLSSFVRTILDDADAATVRSTIGAAASSTALTALGSVSPAIGKVPYFDSTTTATTFDVTAAGRNLVAQNDVAAMRTTLQVVPGTDVQAYDAELAALAALISAANKLPYFTGAGAAALADFTAFARTLLDDADAATMRATLGAQASDAELTALAGLASAANKLPYFTGSGTAALTDISAFMRTLLDDADAATARATLGVSSGWTLASNNAAASFSNSSPLTISGLGSANDILVVFEDLSFPNSNNLVVGISDNNISYATVTATTSTSPSNSYSGAILFNNARADRGALSGSIGAISSNKSISSGAQNALAAWRCDSGISYVAVQTNNASSASGTIKVYTR